MAKKSTQQETVPFPPAFKKSDSVTRVIIGGITADRRDAAAFTAHVGAYQAALPQAIKSLRRFFNELQQDINSTTRFLNDCMPNAKTPVVVKAIADLQALKEDARIVKQNTQKQWAQVQKMDAKQISRQFTQGAAVELKNPAPVMAERLFRIKQSYMPYGAGKG